MNGERYGRWIVIKKAAKDRHWYCRCDCGTRRIVFAGTLRNGRSRSCGCVLSEVLDKRNRTHGMSGTPEHRTWNEIKKRCLKPSHKSYANYGGRGITICAEWVHDFPAFLLEVGQRPTAKHSIGRIQNDRGYEPGNVRWETPIEQANNKRSIRYLTVNGQPIRASLLAARNNITAGAYRTRICAGWPAERAATEPMKWRK